MSWLSSLFGGDDSQQYMGSNPAGAAMPYLDQIKGEYLSPEAYNTIASQYKQSPGYQFRLKQAMLAGNNAAGAGGMLGSGQHQFENMSTAEGLANQDYNNWWQQRMGLNQDLGSVLGQKAQYGFAGQAGQNQLQAQQQKQQQDFMNQLLSLFGGLGTAGFTHWLGK